MTKVSKPKKSALKPQPGGGALIRPEGQIRDEKAGEGSLQSAPHAGPKAPPAQEGDPKVEVAKAEAKPVLKSLDEGKAELDAHPERTSVLTEAGHLVRE